MQTNDCGSCSSACEGRRWGRERQKTHKARGEEGRSLGAARGMKGRATASARRARDAPRASEVRKRRAGFGGRATTHAPAPPPLLPEPPPRGARAGVVGVVGAAASGSALSATASSRSPDASISAVSMASPGGVRAEGEGRGGAWRARGVRWWSEPPGRETALFPGASIDFIDTRQTPVRPLLPPSRRSRSRLTSIASLFHHEVDEIIVAHELIHRRPNVLSRLRPRPPPPPPPRVALAVFVGRRRRASSPSSSSAPRACFRRGRGRGRGGRPPRTPGGGAPFALAPAAAAKNAATLSACCGCGGAAGSGLAATLPLEAHAREHSLRDMPLGAASAPNAPT